MDVIIGLSYQKGEHRLRMFGNRVLREISGFGPNGVELTVGRIKLHNVEFHDLYFPTRHCSGDRME
jgi:hypothetical protein